MSNFEKLADSVLKGDFAGVKSLTQSMVDAGVNPMEIINDGLLAGMDIVAPKFKAGEMFVPEVMMAAKALGEGMEVVKPLVSGDDVRSKGTILIGTVAGDLHDIGKNLVVMILESAGFKVIDLGVDVSADKFIEAIKEHQPQVVGLSALLTTTMPAMKDTIAAIKGAGLENDVKIIVGGAPVSKSFADEIGADGYAADAMAAKEMAETLV